MGSPIKEDFSNVDGVTVVAPEVRDHVVRQEGGQGWGGGPGLGGWAGLVGAGRACGGGPGWGGGADTHLYYSLWQEPMQVLRELS